MNFIPSHNDHATLSKLTRCHTALQAAVANAGYALKESKRQKGTLNEHNFGRRIAEIKNPEDGHRLIESQRSLRAAFDGSLVHCQVALLDLDRACADLKTAVQEVNSCDELKKQPLLWQVAMANVIAAVEAYWAAVHFGDGVTRWVLVESEAPAHLYPYSDMLLHTYTRLAESSPEFFPADAEPVPNLGLFDVLPGLSNPPEGHRLLLEALEGKRIPH